MSYSIGRSGVANQCHHCQAIIPKFTDCIFDERVTYCLACKAHVPRREPCPQWAEHYDSGRAPALARLPFLPKKAIAQRKDDIDDILGLKST